MGLNKNKYQGRRLASVPGKRLGAADSAPEKHPAPQESEPEMHAAPLPEAESVPETAPEQPATARNAEPASPAPESAPESGKLKKAKKKDQAEEKKGFWANYGYLIITAAVVILVFRVLLQLAFVPSGSMEDTIPTNSLLVSWQIPYLVSDPQPERGDVVTFWSEEYDKLLVKRVIGLPGDEITFSGGYVYINGRLLEEDYLPEQGVSMLRTDAVYRVPDGCLFMLGDNRQGSQDSRYWKNPYVKISDVRARVLLCIPVSYHPIGDWKGIPLPIIRDIHLIG